MSQRIPRKTAAIAAPLVDVYRLLAHCATAAEHRDDRRHQILLLDIGERVGEALALLHPVLAEQHEQTRTQERDLRDVLHGTLSHRDYDDKYPKNGCDCDEDMDQDHQKDITRYFDSAATPASQHLLGELDTIYDGIYVQEIDPTTIHVFHGEGPLAIDPIDLVHDVKDAIMAKPALFEGLSVVVKLGEASDLPRAFFKEFGEDSTDTHGLAQVIMTARKKDKFTNRYGWQA